MSGSETTAADARERFSLHGLSAAFARLTGTGAAEEATPSIADALHELQDPAPQSMWTGEVLSPRMIVEGMLFVGSDEGGLLSSREMAASIRNVSPTEVDRLIKELNASYDEAGVPYEIASQGSDYRMQVKQEYESIRQRFYGRVREAKLTTPAIEVLSVVAYRQPVTAEEVTRLRGSRSLAILNQLVRRGLLGIERPEDSPRKPTYLTTERFNRLFHIDSPQDLPTPEELDDK
ncbi:MAG: SMC-Scp complex subunit ScpB [Pirellulales bacterium]|nr:SMC-Scp complex subunit ScpB [Pirellulales bacterium]